MGGGDRDSVWIGGVVGWLVFLALVLFFLELFCVFLLEKLLFLLDFPFLLEFLFLLQGFLFFFELLFLFDLLS